VFAEIVTNIAARLKEAACEENSMVIILQFNNMRV
jgi:hypothetical protein